MTTTLIRAPMLSRLPMAAVRTAMRSRSRTTSASVSLVTNTTAEARASRL
jgi:hypothetical protein